MEEQKDGRSLGPWHDTAHTCSSGSHSFLLSPLFNWDFLSLTANPQAQLIHLEFGVLHKARSGRPDSSHIWPPEVSILILSITKMPFLPLIPLDSKYTSIDSKGTA